MKISIIIPIYNVEPYIEECLQSVATQTFTEGLECVLVDDCGSDNSVAIAESFVDSYKGDIKFSLIHHDKNKGLSAARNTGIKAAKGEYLYFLDSDDTITSDCIEVMCGLIQKYGEVDLVQGNSSNLKELLGNKWQCEMPEYTTNKREIKRFILTYRGDLIAAQCRLIKKRIIENHQVFFRNHIIHEDNHWTFFIAKHIDSIIIDQNISYYHRYNPDSITNNICKVREYNSYYIIIKEMCENIDSFIKGRQKEYILNNLITVLNYHYYSDKEQKDKIINTFLSTNYFHEKILFYIYYYTNYKKIKRYSLHFLIRMYKLFD